MGQGDAMQLLFSRHHPGRQVVAARTGTDRLSGRFTEDYYAVSEPPLSPAPR